MPIRKGISIPERNRSEDIKAIGFSALSLAYAKEAYQLAQTAPNSKEHSVALHMATISKKLPRNNLKLIVRPLGPQEDWWRQAFDEAQIAIRAHELADAKYSLAWHLDAIDKGERRPTADKARMAALKVKDEAILKALMTPCTTLYHLKRLQEMVGRKEWATTYRPDWQALIDEQEVRIRASRPARKVRSSGGEIEHA